MEWVPSEKTDCKEQNSKEKSCISKGNQEEHLITHLMEIICLLPGEKTKLSSLPPTICR